MPFYSAISIRDSTSSIRRKWRHLKPFWRFPILSCTRTFWVELLLRIAILNESLQTSDAVFVLHPERSAWLAAWWLSAHLAAALGVGVSGLPTYVKVMILVGLACHLVGLWPPPAQTIVGSRTGDWALPQLRAYGLRPNAATWTGPYWIRLSLQDSEQTEYRLTLLADQFGAEQWRRLSIAAQEGVSAPPLDR